MRALLSLVVVAASASVVHAEKVAPPAPVAVEIVLQGHEISMGNDDIEPEDSEARYPGMLKALKQSLSSWPITNVLPAGSVVGLITYADRPVIRWPMRDAAMLSPDALGTQTDYYRLIGTDLVTAVDQGVGELVNVRADHKFLVVISDGNDTNMDSAKPAFAALRKRAQALGITPIAIIYKNVLSSPENVITAFDHESQTVVAADSIVNNAEQRIALALAELAAIAPPPPAIVVEPATCAPSWYLRWRWQLAIGSVFALVAMGGVWFVRRERL